MNPKKPTPIPQSLADVEGLMAQVAADWPLWLATKTALLGE